MDVFLFSVGWLAVFISYQATLELSLNILFYYPGCCPPPLSLIDKWLVIVRERLREEISRYLEKFVLNTRWLFDSPGSLPSIKDFLSLLICDTRCVKDLEKHQEHRKLLSNTGRCHCQLLISTPSSSVSSPSLSPSSSSHHHHRHHYRHQ